MVKKIGDSVLVQLKGTEKIYFNSIRIIIECSTIYTSSRKQTTEIPYIMYNTKTIRLIETSNTEKNTAFGCTIRTNNVRSHVLNGCF